MHSIGYQTTPAELDQMIREADQDGLFKIQIKYLFRFQFVGDGLINFDEFKLMMNRTGENQLEIFNDELLNEAFRIFDQDGNGFITEMGLRSVMSNLGKMNFHFIGINQIVFDDLFSR